MRKHFPTTWYCETQSPRFVGNLRREALGKNPANGQRGFCFSDIITRLNRDNFIFKILYFFTSRL